MQKKLMLFPQWQRVLVEVHANNGLIVSRLAKNLDVTYSHLSHLIKELQRSGLIRTESSGRVKKVFVTEKGKSAAVHLKKVISEVN